MRYKLFLYGLLFISPVVIAKESAGSANDVSPIKVQVIGASDELAKNLQAFLPSLRNLKCDSTPRRVERFIDASTEKLSEGAEALGYFNGQFKMTSQRVQGCWVLTITAKPSETVKVTKVSIAINGEGKKLAIFQALLTKPPYKTGDVFVSQLYEDFKGKLKSVATRLGFFDASFTQKRIRVDPIKNTADIALVFDTGERYRLGKITVKQDILGEKHQKRYIRLKEGDPFDSTQLIQQQRILEGSKYYKSVEVRADYQQAKKGVIPVFIDAPRRKRYTYKGGLGYATDDGVYFNLGMEAHWLNRKGHKLNLDMRISEKDPDFGLSYRIPLARPETQYATVSGKWSRSDNDDIRGTALELGFSYHRLSEGGWQQIGSLTYLDEKTEIDTNRTTHSQLSLFGASVSKTVRNDSLFPTRGWRLTAGMKAAAEGVVSDQSILQAEVTAKYLYTLGDKFIIPFIDDVSTDVEVNPNPSNTDKDKAGKIIVQAGVGTTFIGEFNEMPKSLRFFAGGQNSVRGYSFESLGEKDADGDVIGGKHNLILNLEYEHPISDNISAAAFVDIGNAFNELDDFSLKEGYGFGIRYKSPLGPIRVDLAVPEDDASDINLYFSLGPDL